MLSPSNTVPRLEANVHEASLTFYKGLYLVASSLFSSLALYSNVTPETLNINVMYMSCVRMLAQAL